MTLSRFAPSTTGYAHPGTLLSALLVWLDAKQAGHKLLLRLEDIDPQRCLPKYREAMIDDLDWLGLEFDQRYIQSEQRARHESCLDQLAAQGVLFGCRCSRKSIQAIAERGVDGGFIYPGSCVQNTLSPNNWRNFDGALRMKLSDKTWDIEEQSGGIYSQNPSRALGSPVLRRKDGAVAYHLAVVADDISSGVSHIVRGRDLQCLTPTHLEIYQALGKTPPRYRHHFLLLEHHQQKLAKLHHSLQSIEFRKHLSASEFKSSLASLLGMPLELAAEDFVVWVDEFSWENVPKNDHLVVFENSGLSFTEVSPQHQRHKSIASP